MSTWLDHRVGLMSAGRWKSGWQSGDEENSRGGPGSQVQHLYRVARAREGAVVGGEGMRMRIVRVCGVEKAIGSVEIRYGGRWEFGNEENVGESTERNPRR